MAPLQFGSPEVWFVVLLFAVVSVPLLVGVVAVVNRATGTDEDVTERLAELERRVEELETGDGDGD